MEAPAEAVQVAATRETRKSIFKWTFDDAQHGVLSAHAVRVAFAVLCRWLRVRPQLVLLRDNGLREI